MPAGFVNKVLLLGDARPEIIFYAVATVFLAFVAMPVFVFFNGKRYCAWVCGCGALAETLGEPFRHLAPKGLLNRRRERIIYLVLTAAVFMSGVLVLRQAFVSRETADNDRCIDCAQCNRYCEMGIDIKGFALRQQAFTVRNTPCIGCGECIAVCPMNVLKFGDQPREERASSIH